jgi:polyphosphate kinase 2 (PPK2 family)
MNPINKQWKRYLKAYEPCLSATSTATAPWHIVPAEDRPDGSMIEFTFFWKEAQRWEGRNYSVATK